MAYGIAYAKKSTMSIWLVSSLCDYINATTGFEELYRVFD